MPGHTAGTFINGLIRTVFFSLKTPDLLGRMAEDTGRLLLGYSPQFSERFLGQFFVSPESLFGFRPYCQL